MDPYTVAYLAGHSDFSTTKRYVHPQAETVRAAMELVRGAKGGHSDEKAAKAPSAPAAAHTNDFSYRAKAMTARVHLVDMHMEEQPPTNSQKWLGAILGVIGKHPALDIVMFDGDERVVGNSCGTQAEPPLWLGLGSVPATFVQWAIAYARSLGIQADKLSAEAIVGDYFTQSQAPAGPGATDNHLWNPVAVLKGIWTS